MLARFNFVAGETPVSVGILRGEDVDKRSVLKMTVALDFYHVLSTFAVGEYGEKRDDYRADKPDKRPYWHPRLHNRTYDVVKIYGGVSAFDDTASWTLFEFLGVTPMMPDAGSFTAGPYSNGASKTFSCKSMWAVHLGIVLGRHYTHRGNDYQTLYHPQVWPTPVYNQLHPRTSGGKSKPKPPGGKAKSKAVSKKGSKGNPVASAVNVPTVPTFTIQQIQQMQQVMSKIVRDNAPTAKTMSAGLTPVLKKIVVDQAKGKPNWLAQHAQGIQKGVQNESNELKQRVAELSAKLQAAEKKIMSSLPTGSPSPHAHESPAKPGVNTLPPPHPQPLNNPAPTPLLPPTQNSAYVQLLLTQHRDLQSANLELITKQKRKRERQEAEDLINRRRIESTREEEDDVRAIQELQLKQRAAQLAALYGAQYP